MLSQINKGAILVISGPSGCGKSSLLKEVYKQIDNYYFSISTTTREPRDGEKDGVDYFFVSKEEFENGIKDNLFLEYASVHGNYYGTLLKPIIDSLSAEKLIIFDIDVQGYSIVHDQLSHVTTSVFITTPTITQLENRLVNRKTDTQETITKRLKNAQKEIQQLVLYDYFIVNDNLKEASKQLVSIANTSLLKTKLFNINNIIKEWNV